MAHIVANISNMDLGEVKGLGPHSSHQHEKSPEQRAGASSLSQARTYLKNFYHWKSRDPDGIHSHEDFEEPFVCQISTIEWWKLCSEFQLDDETAPSWPRFSYNSATSTLQIYAMPSTVHESVVEFFREHLGRAVHAIDEPLQSRVSFGQRREISVFTREYEDSVKIPDLAVSVENIHGEEEMKLAIEIGFSQTHQQLEQAALLLLRSRPPPSMVVMVNISESPKYKYPLAFDLYNRDTRNIPRDYAEILERDFIYEGDYGPIKYKGHQWAGRISEVTMETWVINPANNEPQRKGKRTQILPPTHESPQLHLGDFLDIGPHDPQMTSFDWDILRNDLKKAIRQLAAGRCHAWLRQSRKRAGLVGDKAYKPF